MAKANELPTLDVQAGAAALDEDIPRVLRVLGASSIEELGWSRPNKLKLFVPMCGVCQGEKEEYTLRLGFQAYRRWPPSAQFVNPVTLDYAYPQDQHFVPKLTSRVCPGFCVNGLVEVLFPVSRVAVEGDLPIAARSS